MENKRWPCCCHGFQLDRLGQSDRGGSGALSLNTSILFSNPIVVISISGACSENGIASPPQGQGPQRQGRRQGPQRQGRRQGRRRGPQRRRGPRRRRLRGRRQLGRRLGHADLREVWGQDHHTQCRGQHHHLQH